MSPRNGPRRRASGQWKPHSPREASGGFRAVAAVVRPAMNLLMGKEWRGQQKLPSTGFIAVANHVSEIDPLAVGHAIYRSGSTLHFLAKDSLFRAPVLGVALRRTQQIPVSRGERSEVGRSLEVAAEVLADGGAIVVYPEGTLTRDPELWPMRAKTGAARLALTTGAPLIPVTHWGVNHFLPPYGKRPKLLPRQKYVLQVGDEIDLSDLRGQHMTRTVLAEATQRVEAALTAGVAQLRGETPPQDIWDRSAGRRVPRNQPADQLEQQEAAADAEAGSGTEGDAE